MQIARAAASRSGAMAYNVRPDPRQGGRTRRKEWDHGGHPPLRSGQAPEHGEARRTAMGCGLANGTPRARPPHLQASVCLRAPSCPSWFRQSSGGQDHRRSETPQRPETRSTPFASLRAGSGARRPTKDRGRGGRARGVPFARRPHPIAVLRVLPCPPWSQSFGRARPPYRRPSESL